LHREEKTYFSERYHGPACTHKDHRVRTSRILKKKQTRSKTTYPDRIEHNTHGGNQQNGKSDRSTNAGALRRAGRAVTALRGLIIARGAHRYRAKQSPPSDTPKQTPPVHSEAYHKALQLDWVRNRHSNYEAHDAVLRTPDK
jgi:hypothetical protein